MIKNILADPIGIVVNDRVKVKKAVPARIVTIALPWTAVFSSTKSKTKPKPSLVMKPIIPFALLGALLAVGAADAAATDPVGYVSLGNAGTVPGLTDMSVAIPLDRPVEFAGTVLSVSGSDLNFSGTPGFTAGAFTATVPYIVKIESGAKAGLVALVTANDVDTTTVSFQNTDTFAGVLAGDQVSVRKAWTVSSFFAGNTVPDFCEFGVWEGIASGIDLAPDKVYYNFGGNWFDQSDDSDANNVVIYPNEGFRLRNTSATAITNLVVSGEVPTTNSRVFVNGDAGQQDSQISYFTPTSEIIGNANIGAGNFDQLLVFDVTQTGFDNAPAFTYYYFGGSWFDASDDSDVTATLQLQGGQRYIYRAEAGRADTLLSDQPGYVPGL